MYVLTWSCNTFLLLKLVVTYLCRHVTHSKSNYALSWSCQFRME